LRNDPARLEFGSEAWKAEKAWLRSTRRLRAALLSSLRCPHDQLPGRCRECDPIDVDRIPF
jgi:hypothetical protein